MAKKIEDWVCNKEGCRCRIIEAVDVDVRCYSIIGKASVSEDGDYLDDIEFISTEFHDTGSFSHYECRTCGRQITEDEIVEFLKGQP